MPLHVEFFVPTTCITSAVLIQKDRTSVLLIVKQSELAGHPANNVGRSVHASICESGGTSLARIPNYITLAPSLILAIDQNNDVASLPHFRPASRLKNHHLVVIASKLQ